MTDPKQIPHLIKLLDDESSIVREAVHKELAAFGPTLQGALRQIKFNLNVHQKVYINQILKGHKRIWLKQVWPACLKNLTRNTDDHDYKKLEDILSVFAEFLSDYDCTMNLGSRLDGLVREYRKWTSTCNVQTLADYLFVKKGIRGDEEDYYNIQNNNLIYVIEEKKGVPLSLALVYMLVGYRLGLRIEGCHFPGHFLAKIKKNGKDLFVDCFNQGQVIDQKELLNIKDETFKGAATVLNEKTGIRSIVRAYLANMIRFYQVAEDDENGTLLIRLFDDLDLFFERKKMADMMPDDIIRHTGQKFIPGECVHHIRYGYRGIIVDADRECRATDQWYYSNQTQPSRLQPWYHVLVHGSDQVTYVAESNLDKDKSKKKVTHPLLTYFFTKTAEGSYIRNDNLWPETDF